MFVEGGLRTDGHRLSRRMFERRLVDLVGKTASVLSKVYLYE